MYDTGSYYSEKQVFQFKNLVNKKVIKLQSWMIIIFTFSSP